MYVPLVQQVALAIVKEQRTEAAEYAEYVKEMAAEGFRPQHCIHGTNLWVDWDPICAGCEDGDTGGVNYRYALDRARRLVAQYDDAVGHLIAIRPQTSDAMFDHFMAIARDLRSRILRGYVD